MLALFQVPETKRFRFQASVPEHRESADQYRMKMLPTYCSQLPKLFCRLPIHPIQGSIRRPYKYKHDGYGSRGYCRDLNSYQDYGPFSENFRYLT